MNSVIVQSRFACLQIEDDNEASKDSSRKRPSVTKITKKSTSTPSVTSKKAHSTKQQQPSVSKKRKGKQQSEQQWEEWKKKDSELVNDNFQQDMQQAILQSKLDYEARKDTVIVLDSQDDAKKNQSNKKKKNKTMSLDQFLNNSPKKEEAKNLELMQTNDVDFFEKSMEDARQAFNKEQIAERRKKRNENIEEVITVAHYQDRLEKERAKNKALQKELETVKSEMESVKARNRTLCSMLSEGEMKDKAHVLLELNRLTTVKDELTQEVTRLHGLLEQERSKTASLTSESKHKTDKKSKKH